MSDRNESDGAQHHDLLRMTADVAAAYLSNHEIAAKDVPNVINSVYQALSDIGKSDHAQSKPQASKAAVPVKRSITPDYLVCLEDGKKLKMLKRHLRTNYNMTPEQYRTKWGLPPDYPMVAPNYAAQRSAFAKKIGLGKGSAPRKPDASAAAQ